MDDPKDIPIKKGYWYYRTPLERPRAVILVTESGRVCYHTPGILTLVPCYMSLKEFDEWAAFVFGPHRELIPRIQGKTGG